jgi:hypothetical protein
MTEEMTEEKTDETRLTRTYPPLVSGQDVQAADLPPTAVDLALLLQPTETEATSLPTAPALLLDDTLPAGTIDDALALL